MVSIDPPKKVILLTDEGLPYDTLIIALGSVTEPFKCDANVYNCSSGAKSLRGALRLNQFFQKALSVTNTVRTLNHKKLKKSDLKMKGIAIALGEKYAVIDLGLYA